MANSEATEAALTPVPPEATRRAMVKTARAVPSLSRDSACRTVRPKRLIPLPSAATAVASVGPRHAPTSSAPPADNPIARPAAMMIAEVMATRTVAERMMPRSARRMPLSETDRASQYSRTGRNTVRTTSLGSPAPSAPGANEATRPAMISMTGPIKRKRLVSAVATMAATQTMMSNSRLMGMADLHGNGLRLSSLRRRPSARPAEAGGGAKARGALGQAGPGLPAPGRAVTPAPHGLIGCRCWGPCPWGRPSGCLRHRSHWGLWNHRGRRDRPDRRDPPHRRDHPDSSARQFLPSSPRG